MTQILGPHFEILLEALQLKSRLECVRQIHKITTQLLQETGKGFNLSGCNLDGFDLSNFDLRCCNLNQAKLYSTKFRGADLSGSSIICPGLERTDFSNVNFTAAYLHAFAAQICDFSDATFCSVVDCTGSLFHGCKFLGTCFENMQLAGSTFYQCDLTDANFAGANLQGSCFNESIVANVNFSHACLSQVVITKSQMNKTCFAHATGEGLIIQRSTSCDGMTFEGANLTQLRLSGLKGKTWNCQGLIATEFDGLDLHLVQVDFTHANLSRARIISSKLSAVTFQSSKIEESLWSRVSLEKCSMVGALAENAHFIECDMQVTDMRGFKGRCCTFRDSNLTDSNLSAAYLYRSFITGDPPKGMSLRCCNLNGANLVQAYIAADLSNATLVNTELTYARLNQSILHKATLMGVNTYDASFVKVNFEGAVFSGFKPPAFFDRCSGLIESINRGKELSAEKDILFIEHMQKLIESAKGSST